MKTRQEQVQALKDKAAKLRVQAQKLEALDSKAHRKLEERKKYVLGAAIMASIKAGHMPTIDVEFLVRTYNKRPSDRALFGITD